MRVLVHLLGLVDEGPDRNRSRSLDPDMAQEKQEWELVRKAVDRLMLPLGPDATRSMTRLVSAPYVAFDADVATLEALNQMVLAGRQGLDVGGGNFVSVVVERVSTLQGMSTPPAVADTTLEQVVLDIGCTTTMAAPTARAQSRRIVVVDDPVDGRYLPLAGRVETRWRILNGYPLPTDSFELPAESGQLLPKLSHGTQVACAASGVAPAALIVSVAVDDGAGGYPFDRILAALDWVHTVWGTKNVVDAVCVSIADTSQSTSGECGISNEASAFALLTSKLGGDGIAVVVAAGNNGPTPGQVFFPACITTAISVSALDAQSRERADFSNWSVMADVAAPGTSMTLEAVSGYDPSSLGPGTSVAAPLVAGVLSRLRVLHPTRPMSDLVTAIVSVTDTATFGGIQLPRLRLDAANTILERMP